MNNLIKFIIVILLAGLSTYGYSNSANESNQPAESKSISKISGNVADIHTGESLAGVMILIEGTDEKTYTDLEGNFEIAIKPGSYNMIASLVSYSKSLVEIKVESGEVKNIDLKMANK